MTSAVRLPAAPEDCLRRLPAYEAAPRAGRTWILIAAIGGSSMTMIDGTAVNVALPVVQRELHASGASVQWVVQGYTLCLSALILTGGALGDRFGRRAMFALGILIFTVASLACALAPSITTLIIARCVQGCGAALATPESLALIGATFSGAERGRAIGTWAGVSVIAAAAGPILGGWLAQHASWRDVFLINLPLGVIVLAVLARVPESRDEHAPRRVDLLGAVLATLGLGLVIYGLTRLQGGRLDPGAGASLAVGIAALVGFVVAERRAQAPVMPLGLFRLRTFAVSNLYTLVLYAVLGGAFFFIPFYLVNVEGYTPTAAGAALLPMIVITFSLPRFTGALVARVGPRLPLVAGAILVAGACLLFARAGAGGSYWTTIFPAAVMLGVGVAFISAPVTNVVLGAVPSEYMGVASGINNAVARTAGLLAVAGLGIVLTSVADRQLTRTLRAAPLSPTAREALVRDPTGVAVGSVPATIPPQDRPVATAIVRTVAGTGFRVTMWLSAALALVGAWVAVSGLPSSPPDARPAPA